LLRPNNPRSVRLPEGSGPRHLALHPNGRSLYVNAERSMTVTAFDVDPSSGWLRELSRHSTVPSGTPTKGVSTAEIVCHPTGRWVYVSNRGHDSVAVFSVGARGELSPVQVKKLPVRTPRSIAIDPTGTWLLAAGQTSDDLVSMKIDLKSGTVGEQRSTLRVAAPVCIAFAPYFERHP
jgi:6-phosphogluconolactonase